MASPATATAPATKPPMTLTSAAPDPEPPVALAAAPEPVALAPDSKADAVLDGSSLLPLRVPVADEEEPEEVEEGVYAAVRDRELACWFCSRVASQAHREWPFGGTMYVGQV